MVKTTKLAPTTKSGLRRIAPYHWAILLTVSGLALLVALDGARRIRLDDEEYKEDADFFAGGPRPEPALVGASQPWSPREALPKVALMVLTRGYLRTELIWWQFLAVAVGVVRPGEVISSSSNSSGTFYRPLPDGWQLLFSLYVHPRPSFAFPARSIFSGREVPHRVVVEWAQPSMIAAQRALLRAALGDPLNQRFVLLSDSCIPLYPPATVYRQLMSERRSRVNACQPHNPRWQPAMEAFGLRQEQWRKSSQWSTLTRAHAEAVTKDERINTAFQKHCLGVLEADGKVGPRFCIADEHYVPTLLAHLGLEGECDCGAVSTHTAWEWPASHPKAYSEATLGALEEMREGDCQSLWTWGPKAKKGIQAALKQLERQQQHLTAVVPVNGSGAGSAAEQVQRGLEAVEAAFNELGVATLPSRCPMFGRKVPPRRAFQWAHLLQPVLAA